MALITWLHISDTHMRSSWETLDEHGRGPVTEALWRDLRNRAAIDPELDTLDFIFFTGDMAYSGRNDEAAPEYDAAFNRFAKPLCEVAGVPLERFYMTPGNHDIDRTKVDIYAQVLQRGLQQQEEIHALFTEPTMEHARQHLFQRQSAYREFVASNLSHIHLHEKTLGFTAPGLVTKAGATVNVVGINTSWLAYGDKIDQNRLVVGEWQLARLLQESSEEILTIALLHHPISGGTQWFHPMESATLKQLRSRVQFVLAGHLHEANAVSSLSTQGSIVELTSGAFFEKRSWPNSYMYVKFDTATGKGNAYIRIFSDGGPSGPAWHPDSIGTGNPKGEIPILLYEPANSEASPQRLVTDLVRRQSVDLGNRPLLAHYADRDAIRTLFPEIYVDPFIKPRKEPTAYSLTLKEWLIGKYQLEDKVLLLGPPGAGKTTALISIHRQATEAFLTGDAPVPIFLDARAVGPEFCLGIDELLPVAAKSIGLDPNQYKRIPLSSKDITVLVDGLDEAQSTPVGSDYGAGAISHPVPTFPHIASCRTDFYERQSVGSDLFAGYTEILELESWRSDRELPRFLEAYFRKVFDESQWAEEMGEFQKIIDHALEQTDIISTPLAVTILLFIWRYDRDILGTQVTNSADLLNRFVNVWAKRETERDGSCFNHTEQLLQAFEVVALVTSQTRGGVSLADIVAAVSSELRVKAKLLAVDSGLRSLLRLRDDHSNPIPKSKKDVGTFLGWLGIRSETRASTGWTVISFAHELFREFLLARRIVRAFEENTRIQDVLFVAPEYWVNKLARQLLEAWKPSQLKQTVRKLQHLYEKARGRRDERWVVYRDNVCYFWGRLAAKIEGERSSLRDLYWDIRRKKALEHPMVIGTIATGVLLSNDIEVEQDYLDHISNGLEDDIRNRKYHLVYYGDHAYEGSGTYLTDLPRPGVDDWQRTRAALLRRLSSLDQYEQLLRGLNIVTYTRFCQTRGVPEHAPEQIRILKTCTDNLQGIPAEKAELIKAKHSHLMHLIGQEI